MSTDKNCNRRGKDTSARQWIYAFAVMAFVAAVLFSTHIVSYAGETDDDDIVATLADAPVSGVVLDSDGYYRYYENNTARKDTGWFAVDAKTAIYIDAQGHVIKEYNKVSDTLYVYAGGSRSVAANSIGTLDDGKQYFFDKNGVRVKKSGWHACGIEKYYIDDNYTVTMRYRKQGQTVTVSTYDSASSSWVLIKSKWVTLDDGEYYLDEQGVCSLVYYTGNKKAYNYTDGRFQQAKNECVVLSDGKTYFFGSNGVKCTTKNWYIASDGTDLYVGQGGNVKTKIVKSGKLYSLRTFNTATKSWSVKKNCWITSKTRLYYFSKSGNATTVYNLSTNVLYKYSSAKRDYVVVRNSLSKLNGSTYSYFNAKGKKVTKKGWVKASSNVSYYIGKSGSVTTKYTNSNGVRKLYSYNSKTGKWVLKKNKWQSIGKTRIYFGAKGTATTRYDTDSKKAFVYSGGKWKLAKKKLVKIDSYSYYFDASGKKVSKSGWYRTSDDGESYVSKKGRVSEKIVKSGKQYKLYKFNGKSKKWVLKKNTWKKTATRMYYFTAKGSASLVYDLKTKKLLEYSSQKKKYVAVKNELRKLNSSKYAYYNKNGKKVTSEGWVSAGKVTSYYINKKGYVTTKYTNRNGVRKIYDYNYSKKTWVLKKSQWRDVGDLKVYFSSNGVANVYYNTKTKKAYTYSNKKWKSVKKAIRKIGTGNHSNYYFNAKGVRVTKAGVYKTSNGYLAYVNKSGWVYKREYDLTYKRYYTIELGKGKSTKVYGYYDISAANALVKEVNQHRADNGFTSLDVSTSLTDTANTRALEVSNKYSHYRPNGTLCVNSMYELYGENLACGFASEDLVFRAWKKSTDHNNNMLNATKYKTIGASVFVALKNDKEGYKTYYVLTFGK